MDYEFEQHQRYISRIVKLPQKGKYKKTDLLIDDFCMFVDEIDPSIKVYYCPFDYYEKRCEGLSYWYHTWLDTNGTCFSPFQGLITFRQNYP